MENGDLKHLENLITDLVGSLEREMRAGFAKLEARLDVQGARLVRHGGWTQSGSRWPARMAEWPENVDTALERTDPRNRRNG